MWWLLLMKEESSTMILYNENMGPGASWYMQMERHICLLHLSMWSRGGRVGQERSIR